MSLDPKLLQELIETFKSELGERLQKITAGLLELEKNSLTPEARTETISEIFRAGHNIKGAAQGIGFTAVGEIAHQIESLFAAIKQKTVEITPEMIDLCLEAVDSMAIAMESHIEKKPLPFDLAALLSRLKMDDKEKTIAPIKKNKPPTENIETKKIKNSVAPRKTKDHESIRVTIESLDRISALMEEIQVNKIAIDDHYTELSGLAEKTKQFNHLWKQILFTLNKHLGKESSDHLQKLYNASADDVTEINNTTAELHKNMHGRINELAILSNSLQEEVRTLRLIPADFLLGTLPRTVRTLSSELNKKVELEIKGDQVKLDKLVLEGLQDPIMHLLRNAIDHGIETPEIRKQRGKTEMGHIIIDIEDRGDQILIAIKDDGGGIDFNKIAAIAAEKKLLPQAELNSMSKEELIDLIFMPGFSTTAIITDVSGRGVGLDVVKTNLENLKGQVSVSTELGKGTTFYLRVPLTLASERGLMVSSGGQLFVIPTSGIERVIKLNVNEIVDVEASQAIILNKHSILLRALVDVLALEKKEPLFSEQVSIVVIRKGSQAVALLVDEILGEREIVIKPLQEPLMGIPSVAGGTLSGNGQVIVVLNTNDLIARALHTRRTTRVVAHDEKEKSTTIPHILVVDDSITTRTLEKNILENNNYKVTIAVNGKEAWDLLQKQTFSLLITDVSMPIMDGFTLTEHVKQSEKLRALPVIIVTSLDSDAEKKRGIDVGANAYIVKNQFESGALLEIVAQLI